MTTRGAESLKQTRAGENANPDPAEAAAGTLGVEHLQRYWSRVMAAREGRPANEGPREWLFDQILLSGLGLAVEETIQYLYQNAPGLEEFEKWILERNGGGLEAERVARINGAIRGTGPTPSQRREMDQIANAEPVLSAEDLAFWEENGYVVARGVVSKEESQAAAELVWQHLGMNPNDPETWYQRQGNYGIMVQLFHHPALQRNRQSRRLHKAFAQLWGTAELWVTTDRVSFNPPERPGWPFPGPRLHWDTSLELPIPFGVQGLLYLTDTAASQGAFTCVPGFQRRIADWLKGLPPGANPREQDLEKLGTVPIPGEAGDLVIWHQALPHGSSPNRAARPRMVQYITMFPPVGEEQRKWR